MKKTISTLMNKQEAKLLGDRAKEVKEKPKFNVGDYVRIRQWGNMAKEFAVSSIGAILTPYGFTVDMRPLCGTYAEIVNLGLNGQVKLKFFNCKDLEDLTNTYSFDIGMIEKV